MLLNLALYCYTILVYTNIGLLTVLFVAATEGDAIAYRQFL